MGLRAAREQVGQTLLAHRATVCIEKASAYHANVMMKRYGSASDEQLLSM